MTTVEFEVIGVPAQTYVLMISNRKAEEVTP